VRLLHGDRRRQGACGLPDVDGQGAGADHHPRGLDPTSSVDRYAEAFAATGALQCGFCTPGIVVRAKALIDKKGAELTRDEAARHLGAHLCRCTGYVKILDAIEALAHGEIPVPIDPAASARAG
jgi:aldehyde oxidoreductase